MTQARVRHLGHGEHPGVVGCLLPSAAAGKGMLNYNGRRHHFTISGVGAGGAGGQKTSATGKVYNLISSPTFPELTTASAADSPDRREDACQADQRNGVVMYLAGQTEGLASSMGRRHLRST